MVIFHFWHLHLQVSFSARSSQLFRCAPMVASSPQTGQNYFYSRCLSPRRRPCPSLRDWIHWVWRPHPTPSALSQVCFCLSLDPVLFHLARFLQNMSSVCLQRNKRLWCGCRGLHSVCYSLSSGCDCKGLFCNQKHEKWLDSCPFPFFH